VDARIDEALVRVDRFLDGLSPKRMRPARFAAALPDLQLAALHHRDPQIRRYCLGILDHHANDESMHVFARALSDEADVVRDVALHSIACESCKSEELCPADVVPALCRVLDSDPKPDLRIKALAALTRLMSRDERVRGALERAARTNSDAITRQCAADALHGCFVMPKKRYERRQRRQPSLGSSSIRSA
jgi:hypothetical protein